MKTGRYYFSKNFTVTLITVILPLLWLPLFSKNFTVTVTLQFFPLAMFLPSYFEMSPYFLCHLNNHTEMLIPKYKVKAICDFIFSYFLISDERYAYDVHEDCLIFKTPHLHPPSTSKIFPRPWPWTFNFKPTPPPYPLQQTMEQQSHLKLTMHSIVRLSRLVKHIRLHWSSWRKYRCM